MTEPVASATASAQAPTPVMTPGTRLAQARIAHGLSVEGVAQQLKFSSRQIEALEGDRYDELSGLAVVRGMVRGYARLVQVDAAPLLEALRDVVPAPDAGRIVARFEEPVPFSDPSKRTNLVYVVFTLAVLVVAALVLVQWRQERPQPARMSFVAPATEQAARTTVASAGGVPQARPAQESPVPAQPTTGREADHAARAASAADADAKQQTAAPAQAAEPADGAATQSASAAAAGEAAAKPAPTPVAAAEHRVRIEFIEDAWVEIRDGSGKLLHAQLNSAGSEVRVEGEAPLAFVIGNAQFVRVSYNGRSVDLTPHIRVAVARFKLP